MKALVRLAGALLLVLGSSIVSVRANAQQPILKFRIPFEFTAGDTGMPAGEYTIKMRQSALVLETAGHIAVIQSFESHAESESGTKLVFRQYGNQYFLHEILSPNVASLNRLVTPSKAEKEAGQREEPVVVAVR